MLAFYGLLVVLYIIYFVKFIEGLKLHKNGKLSTKEKILYIFFSIILVAGTVLMICVFWHKNWFENARALYFEHCDGNF
jgi:hypothetical protein